MKKVFSLIVVLSLIFQAVSYSQNGAATRISKNVNQQWTFNYFPYANAGNGYESPSFNDAQWPAISIPHTWSTYEVTGQIHPFIRNASETESQYWWLGWGWYRKHFVVNTDLPGRSVFIEFEGVQKYCKIWINGKYLGDHSGGYGSFDFDITQFIKPGSDNVLAIAVNNKQNDDKHIFPMAAGDFNVYGGIYRDVTIVIKDNLHIPMQGSAVHEGGTFITTPVVNVREAVARVRTWVKNSFDTPKTCTLTSTVTDSTGKNLQTVKSLAEIAPGQIYMFDQTFKSVKNPRLWSPENPYQYKLISQVSEGKRIADETSSNFGFRWFSWDQKENKLLLNGTEIILHGGSRNQDYPWLGDATPKWITLMDLTDISLGLNFNYLGTTGYPEDKYVFDLTDRMGIIAEDGIADRGNHDFSQPLLESQIIEMVRRDRNHPSILFWNIYNGADKNGSKIALSEDSTRLLNVEDQLSGSILKNPVANKQFEGQLQCAVRGWYNKDVKDVDPADPWQCGTEEYQQSILKAGKKFGRGNILSSLYADHGADRDFANAPVLHLDPSGFTDLYRLPKYGYYFWQANYSKKLNVFIQPHNWRSKYLDQLRDIVVSSNANKVELFVNGVSKGYKILDTANFNSVIFDRIKVEAGVLTAVATKGSETIMSEIFLAGRPVKIVIKASDNKIDADRSSLVIVTADIADAGNNHVYGASNTLRWSVSGPATLVGPPIYETDINKNGSMDGVWYIDAPVSNIIRSTGVPGKIKISVAANGLNPATIEIEATELQEGNQVISWQALKNEGRQPVRIMLESDNEPEFKREINKETSDLVFDASVNKSYKRLLNDRILSQNSSVDTTSVECRTLVRLLDSRMIESGGRLNAGEFNTNADRFNKCRIISGYINSTKLPPVFKEELKKFYSKSIITEGKEKNSQDEMNWLNWIPSGGTVVIVADSQARSADKSLLYCNSNDLSSIITSVYPQFAKFSEEAKERALTFTAKANPYVHRENDSTSSGFIAEKGKAILVPLLKFISE